MSGNCISMATRSLLTGVWLGRGSVMQVYSCVCLFPDYCCDRIIFIIFPFSCNQLSINLFLDLISLHRLKFIRFNLLVLSN